jgi:hypothetical protein
MKFSPNMMPFAAFVSIFMAVGSSGLLIRAFHGGFSQSTLIIGLIWLLLLSCAGAFLVIRFNPFDKLILNGILLFSYAMSIYNIGISHLAIYLNLTWLLPGYIFVAISFSYWLCHNISEITFQKIEKFIASSLVIFILSPYAIAYTQDIGEGNIPTLSLNALNTQASNENVVVLLLDETSPEYASTLMKPLTDSGLSVVYKTVEAAGKNTINAIPSMLTNKRHDDVRPCSITMLCGPNAIDFLSLHAANANTDIIGFHFPYCQIQGLRFCYDGGLEQSPENTSYINWVIYRACEIIPKSINDALCFGKKIDGPVIEIRDNLIRNFYKTPFWSDGGLLYAHLPLPHLPSKKKFDTDTEAYEENVKEAATLIADIASKLKLNFGSNFTLVITSDHAYRKSEKCNSLQHLDIACSKVKGLPANRGLVPLIVASPKKLNLSLPNTNVGLFAPHLRQNP